MNRIHNFSSFSKLYEAEEGEKKISDFQNLIQMSVANILNCYKKQTLMSKENPYVKMLPDYDSIIAAPGVDSFKKILDVVKSSAADDAKDTAEAWSKAGSSFLGVLSKIYELMPNNKDAINKIISDYVKDKTKPNVVSASKDNEAKAAIEKAEKEAAEEAKDESEQFEDGEKIYEVLDFLKGKKGKLKDISKQITSAESTLRDFKAIDFLKDEADKQSAELKKIEDEIGKMAFMKNRDIDEEKIEEYTKKVSEILKELEDKQKELASQNETTKEAALLFTKATEDLSRAQQKDSEYLTKKATEKSTEEGKKKDEDEEKKIAEKKKDIGFSKTLKKSEIGSKSDKTVEKIQKLIDAKFTGKIKTEDSDAFNKFTKGKFAGDGYFGNNTEKVIKGIKAGLGMKADDSDITEELIDKILSIKESEDFKFGRFRSFGSFESLNEKYYKDVKFDVDKFLEVADDKKIEKKELPNRDAFMGKLKEMVEETYKNNKEAIDYIISKDFEPNEAGKKFFRNIFRSDWDNFSKYTDDKKKNAVSIGIRTTLLPITGKDKITKEMVDFYLKPEGA
jgi:hypothetical protein